MNKITANGKLEIAFPDGFHVMDAKEKNTLSLLSEGDFEAVSDPERHITATVGWKNTGLLTSLLVSAYDVAGITEKQVSAAMDSYGYSMTGPVKRKVAGSDSEGFGYTYSASGTEMSGQTLVLKKGRTLYYLNVYFRRESEETGLEVWNSILDSAVEK